MTFSVYAQGNDEPFFQYRLEEEIVSVDSIDFHSPNYKENLELVALFDCSSIGSPNCGIYRNDRLYGIVLWLQ